MEIWKSFKLECAHLLPKVPPKHKCNRLHGHSYEVSLQVSGEIRDDGMVLDFAEIKRAWKKIDSKLDHRYLNDVPGLENPTAENMAKWIYDTIILPGLSAVMVSETCTAGATYRGNA